MKLDRQMKWLIAGSLQTILPVMFWILLPDSFLLRVSSTLGIEDRLFKGYGFAFSAVIQLLAIYVLQFAEKPSRWVKGCSVIAGLFAVLVMIAFFCATTGVLMQGW